MKELETEVARGSGDSQQIQPRSKNPIVKHGIEQPPGLLDMEFEIRCLVLLRKRKLKNGETSKELCASVCRTCR